MEQFVNSRYELKKLLGRGAMGDVFEAKDHHTDKRVVVKLLRRGYVEDDRHIKAFERELEASRRLQGPHIAKIIDAGREKDDLFLVMEHIEAKPLNRLIEEEAPLEPRKALQITRQVLIALSEAHGKGVLHRDLKPQNILISETSNQLHAMVIDFGLAHLTTLTSHTQHAIGTPLYISPEQANGTNKLDGRSDIYSLGVILYEMLTGCTPFQGDACSLYAQHIHKKPKAPSKQKNNIGKNLDRLVLKALEKKPAQRFRSAVDMLNSIEQLEQNPPNLWQRLNLPVKVIAGLITIVGTIFGALEYFQFSAISNLRDSLNLKPVNSIPQKPMSSTSPVVGRTQPIVHNAVLPNRPKTKAIWPGTRHRDALDGAWMVYVPPGAFVMGHNDGMPDERPSRRVQLNEGFWIDQYEVTTERFQQCVQAGACPHPTKVSTKCNWGVSGKQQHPINCISWIEASQYCKWANKELPTEAQWEKAARSTDQRLYPWGASNPDPLRIGRIYTADDAAKHSDKHQPTEVVGDRPVGAGPYGTQGQIGNLYEWVADCYEADFYSKSPSINPYNDSCNTQTDQQRVVRGGRKPARNDEDLRLTYRNAYSASTRSIWLGFRCVRKHW
jgi:serine/threonine-protein kinase